MTAVAVLAVLAGAALAFAALTESQRLAERLDGLQRRLEVLAAIDGVANHYGEQVAIVLLTGREDLADLQSTRVSLERHFARLSQVTRAEIERLSGQGGVDDELRTLDNARRMTELYHAIDRSTARASVSLRDGKPEEAIATFRTDVAFRLTNELQPLIDADIISERNQTAQVVAAASESRQGFMLLGGGLGIGGLIAAGSLGIALGWASRRAATEVARQADAASEALRVAEQRLGETEVRHIQFLTDVSHELRTPLTILRGEADVALRADGDPADLRLALERVQGQAEELAELLEDMTALARMDLDEVPFSPTALRIDELIEATAEEGAVLAEPREVAIATQLRSGAMLVNGDGRRLKRALLIGIDNAIKHSPPGGRLTLSAERQGDSVAIAILDDGPGVPEDELPHVFERFFRGRAEKEMQNRGIGIGLPIAREIVEQHGGRVTLRNRPEGGAVLTMVLPCGEASVK
ncbi:MAG: HAMP domain-containing histidine kinase [Devosia sp.]|nr:HAMP domain-containing histidine kinase [Devosia sp.]